MEVRDEVVIGYVDEVVVVVMTVEVVGVVVVSVVTPGFVDEVMTVEVVRVVVATGDVVEVCEVVVIVLGEVVSEVV